MYKIKYTEDFDKDKDAILNYISDELHAPKSAINLWENIEGIASKLSQFPNMGKRVGEIEGEECRLIPAQNYLLFYVVIENIIEIRAFMYGKVDWQKLFE